MMGLGAICSSWYWESFFLSFLQKVFFYICHDVKGLEIYASLSKKIQEIQKLGVDNN